MTKDVLVSISGKHIDIMEDPTAGYETGDDSIEVVTPASYYCKNGKHYIIYDEILEGKAGTIRNKIRITGNETGPYRTQLIPTEVIIRQSCIC